MIAIRGPRKYETMTACVDPLQYAIAKAERRTELRRRLFRLKFRRRLALKRHIARRMQ